MPFSREEIDRTVAEYVLLIDGGLNGIRIHEDVIIRGNIRELPIKAMIDTGATSSILTTAMARDIGAADTNRAADPNSFLDGEERICEGNKYYAKLKIPSISEDEVGFVFTVCNRVDLCKEGNPPIEVNHPIIGMDVMRKLRLMIDTTKSRESLSVKPDANLTPP